jgi:hypothetical protein
MYGGLQHDRIGGAGAAGGGGGAATRGYREVVQASCHDSRAARVAEEYPASSAALLPERLG